MTTLRQFLRFSLVGGVGFLVDVGVLYAALSAGLGLYAGRGVSFLAAATFTWAANRRFTFASRVARSGSEWSRYIGAMAVGGAINYLVYAVLVSVSGTVAAHPWFAVAAGTASGMLVNFVLARRILYRPA